MLHNAKSSLQASYLNVPYKCSVPFNANEFFPVNVHSHSKGWSVVGKWYNSQPIIIPPIRTLKEAFDNLHPFLKQICGKIQLPPDDDLLLHSLTRDQQSIFGASDASLKDDRASHAWILSSGKIHDISNPLLHISGSGSVHGAPQYLSSSRGEPQGLTALTIATKVFSNHFNTYPKSTFICDNTGVQRKISQSSFSSLCSQQDTNKDLYLTQKECSGDLKINLEWIKSHSEKKGWQSIKDLEDQKLTRDQIYNVWCDRMAEIQWQFADTSFLDPEVSPSERWGIYATQPYWHKLTGNLDTGFYSMIGYHSPAKYISDKHNICDAKLQKVHMIALSKYLSSLKPFQRASIVKVIHGWIPTYGMLCRQGRESSPLCPRCSSTVETWDHVFSCPDSQAIAFRNEALLTFLSLRVKMGTPLYILSTFEYKLSLLFALPFPNSFPVLSPIPTSTKHRLMDAI
jgi:hypothetical protein